MPSPDPNQTFVMDLAALLKAFREVRDGAAQVVEQLTARLEACRDLDTKAATALTQAVQQATTTLQQEQARTSERLGAETRRQQEALMQRWQQVVRVQRWLPWKVALLLLVGTLLVNAGGLAWWGWQLATERRELRQATALATDLDRYLRETLYAQLSAPQKQAIETIYRAHTLPSPSKRFP